MSILGTSYGVTAVCSETYKLEIRVREYAVTDVFELGEGMKLKGFVRKEIGKLINKIPRSLQ